MNVKELKPYFVVIGLLLVTSLALAFTVDVSVSNKAGVRVYFPDRVNAWMGDELRFCQNPDHRATFHMSELSDPDTCPECGAKLSSMTIAEKKLLPEDTILLKKKYENPAGETVHASIVLSGTQRSSIHRPQVCLVGQGNEIIRDQVISVPLPGREPLDVMVLDMIRRHKRANGDTIEMYTYYAYWFVGQNRETPYHIERMFWMASDRILFNVAHRWAYISVSGVRERTSNAHHDEIREFIGELYPEMAISASEGGYEIPQEELPAAE